LKRHKYEIVLIHSHATLSLSREQPNHLARDLELIVPADEAESVVADLDAALDQMEEKHTLFGGGTETVTIEHSGTRRRSALSHTLAAGKTAVGAIKTARERVTAALHLVI
jgi:hypothetical protein